MTDVLPIDELEVIAVFGAEVPAGELRAIDPVFRRRGAAELAVWPIRVERERVVGAEVALDVLEAQVATGAVVMLAQAIDARGSDWALIGAGGGRVRYVRRDELWGKQQARMRDWLGAAVSAWHDGDHDASMDLFDKAYLSSRRGLVAAVLRAGAARLSEDASWEETCFGDLARTLEYQGAAMLSCRANALWSALPHPSLRAELFDEARRGFDERSQPETTLEPSVPAATAELAVAFALFRRSHPGASARLSSKLVVRAVAGDPDGLAAIAAQLAKGAEWAAFVQEARQAMSTERGDIAEVLARARLEDFSRFARTLYTLEISGEEHDRRASWTSFCRITAGVDAEVDGLPWRAGERLADEARRRLGLNGDPISGLRRFVGEQAGVFVGRMGPIARYDCASSAPRNTPPCMFVEHRHEPTADDVLRARFAVAHELGHLLADRHAASGWVCSTVGHDRSDSEKRANAFVAYFIAPRHAVVGLVPVLPAVGSLPFRDAVQQVRARFGLSATAAAEHLRNCHHDHTRDPLPGPLRAQLTDDLAEMPIEVDEGADGDDEIGAVVSLRGGRYRMLVERLRCAGILDEEAAGRLLEPS